ncbi:flavoprotein [Nocardia sp. KC 131]|uniref:flavoprotein n=1 Tax=Nocardia arseniciresistens TaxID=3392119 RepID=UPI00398EE8C5
MLGSGHQDTGGSSEDAVVAGPPELGISRMLLVITGSASATAMPFWVTWLRETYPELQITIVVTRMAQRFVTRQALALRIHDDVLIDEWPADAVTARHVELCEWAQAILVYPATMQFIARLALGMADSPALLAAQCSSAPIAIAPALPPGGLDSAALRRHWATLAERDNIVLMPPREGKSLTTGRMDGWVPTALPDVLRRLEACRHELDKRERAVGLNTIDWRAL